MDALPAVGAQNNPAPIATKDGAKKNEVKQKPYEPKNNGQYTVENDQVTFGKVALTGFFGTLSLSGCSSAKTLETYQLSEIELGALESSLSSVYKEVLPLRQFRPFFSVITRRLPKATKSLEHPIQTLGAVTTIVHQDKQSSKLEEQLEQAIKDHVVNWEENGKKRSLKITDFVIHMDPTNMMGHNSLGGGGMGLYQATVTIYPLKVRVSEK